MANFTSSIPSRPCATNWSRSRSESDRVQRPERVLRPLASTRPGRRSPNVRARNGLRLTLPVAVTGSRPRCARTAAPTSCPCRVARPGTRRTRRGRTRRRIRCAAITRSPVRGSGTGYTTTARTPLNRAITFSTGPAAKFSPSTRNQSDDAPGEEERAVVAAVAEIAGPVPTVAAPLGGRFGVLVVALERAQPVAPDDLADGFGRIEQDAVVVEARPLAFVARLRVEHDDVDAFGRLAQRVLRHAGVRRDHDAALARAVALDDEATEAAAKLLAVGGRRLRAEAVLQLVVGVVGRFGLGEDVAQRPADVVEVRRVVPAHVGHELRRRELAAQRDRRAADDRREQVGQQRVAVEQRHGAIQNVVGPERDRALRSRARRPALRHLHRLRRTRRPRREDQAVQRVGDGTGRLSGSTDNAPRWCRSRCRGRRERTGSSVTTTEQSVWRDVAGQFRQRCASG